MTPRATRPARAPSLRRGTTPLLLLILSLLVAPTPASSQRGRGRNPYDREQQRLVRAVESSGRRPEGILPLLELWSHRQRTTPGTTRAALERLQRSRRLAPPLRAYASALYARAQVRAGDLGGARATVDALGYVRSARFIGPFDNEGKAGFARTLPPETDRDAPVQPGVEYSGRERAVRWRVLPDIAPLGYIDLDAVLRPNVNVCGFVETFVRVERARPLTVWAGAGGAVALYWNGEEVFRDAAYGVADMDRGVAAVDARAGWNRLLAKVCVMDRAWGLYLRVGEADGGAPRGVTIDAMGATEASAPAGPGASRRADTPLAPLAALAARVDESPDSARAHYQLARFLDRTGADDPAENRARRLAARAAELEPSVEHLLFAAALAETRAEKMRFVARAEEEAPRSEEVRLRRAILVLGGPDAGRALRMLEGFSASSIEGMKAETLRAAILKAHELPLASLAIVDGLSQRSGGAPYWLRQRRDLLDALGRSEDVVSLQRRLVQTQYDAFDARRALISDAMERGEDETVLAQLDIMQAIEPGDARIHYYAASVLEGLGRNDEALALYQRVVDLAPDESAYRVSLGRALLRFEQQPAAVVAFREALELRPQDTATRRLLERLERTDRPDEAYATPIEELLARRQEQSRWPVRVLHDLTVDTVYENGLSSTFRQVAFQVHSDEGARRSSTYSVPYEPGSQWVDLRSARIYRPDGTIVEAPRTSVRRLGDPRYRIYYDTRAMVIDLPELEPGDMVEIRYRVEDVSRRNAFNDYYGDVQILQRREPVARLERVLITPSGRDFHFNDPGLAGLHHEREERGGQRIDRFVAADIPPLRTEARMPGATEVAPYIHVSTYRTWEDVGRWWWGLAQDQLVPDEELERTVEELVEGAPDTRTKVERIYAWVIRNTRYVGLEFGIHGFKPYRVTQVVRRGFGDCKDKASLLYVMLRLAGIDARIALVRTRRNGDIAHAPASLAVFDHAIAYVPELDLYLDGTAESAGSRELPGGDQGVMTLVVGPEDAVLRRTPVLPAERERRTRRLEARLAADGSASIEGEETIVGSAAARYRTTYQAEGTRTERLQEELASSFPGIELTDNDFPGLDDFERPVHFTYRGTAPQLGQRVGDDLRVQPSIFGNLVPALAAAPTRSQPIDLGTRYSYVEDRILHLAPGMRVVALPSGGEARSDFGHAIVRYAQSGDRVEIHTELVLERDRVEAAEYPAFRAWVQAVDALTRERIRIGANP